MGYFRLQLFGNGILEAPLIFDVVIPIGVRYEQGLHVKIGNEVIESFEFKQVINKLPEYLPTRESVHE